MVVAGLWCWSGTISAIITVAVSECVIFRSHSVDCRHSRSPEFSVSSRQEICGATLAWHGDLGWHTVTAHLPLINPRYDLIDRQWTFYLHFSSSAVSVGPSLPSFLRESYRGIPWLNVTTEQQPDISMIRWEKGRFIIIKFSTNPIIFFVSSPMLKHKN